MDFVQVARDHGESRPELLVVLIGFQCRRPRWLLFVEHLNSFLRIVRPIEQLSPPIACVTLYASPEIFFFPDLQRVRRARKQSFRLFPLAYEVWFELRHSGLYHLN